MSEKGVAYDPTTRPHQQHEKLGGRHGAIVVSHRSRVKVIGADAREVAAAHLRASRGLFHRLSRSSGFCYASRVGWIRCCRRAMRRKVPF